MLGCVKTWKVAWYSRIWIEFIKDLIQKMSRFNRKLNLRLTTHQKVWFWFVTWWATLYVFRFGQGIREINTRRGIWNQSCRSPTRSLAPPWRTSGSPPSWPSCYKTRWTRQLLILEHPCMGKGPQSGRHDPREHRRQRMRRHWRQQLRPVGVSQLHVRKF